MGRAPVTDPLICAGMAPVALGRLVADRQAEAVWNRPLMQQCDCFRRKLCIYSTGEATVIRTRQPVYRTEAVVLLVGDGEVAVGLVSQLIDRGGSSVRKSEV